ncbi:hypothetical protein pb186bvf_011515 [Paramecium bursaria]
MSFGYKYNTRGAYSNDDKPAYSRNMKEKLIGSYRVQFAQQKLDHIKDNSLRPLTFYSTDILCQPEYKDMNSARIRCEDYFLISQNLLDKEGQNVVVEAMNQIRPRFSKRIFMNQNPTTQQKPPCSAKFEMIQQYKEAPRASTLRFIKHIYPQDDSKAFESDNNGNKNELPDTKFREELIVCTLGNSYKNPISGIDEKKFEVIVKKVVKENQNAPQNRGQQQNANNIYGNPTYQNAYKQPDAPPYGQNPPLPLFQQTQNLAANQSNVPQIFQQNNALPLFNQNANPLAGSQIKAPWSTNNNLRSSKPINIFDKMNSGQNTMQNNPIPLFQQNNQYGSNQNQNPFVQQQYQNPFGQQNQFAQQNSLGQQNPFGQQNQMFNSHGNQQNFDSKYILSTNQKGFRQFEQFYNANYNQHNYNDEQIMEIFKQVVNKFSEADSKYKGSLVMNKNNQQIFQFHPEDDFDDYMRAEKYQTQAQALKMAIENVHNQPPPVYHCNPQGLQSIEVLPYNGTFNLENQSYIVVPDSLDPRKVKLVPTEEVYKFTQNLSSIHQLNKTPAISKELKYHKLESFDKRIIKFDDECEGEDLNYMNSLKQKIYQEQKLAQKNTKNQQQIQQPSQNQNVKNQLIQNPLKQEIKLVESKQIEDISEEQDQEQERRINQADDKIRSKNMAESRLIGEIFKH